MNSKIDFQKKISDTLVDEIANKFEFLAKRKEKGFLLYLVDPKTQKSLADDFKKPYYNILLNNSLRNAFTNMYKTSADLKTERLVLDSETKIIDIRGYQYLINFNSYSQDSKNINGDIFQIDTQSEVNNEKAIKIILNSKETVDFSPAMNKLFESNTGNTETVKLKEISMESDLGKYHIKIVFPNISRDKTPYNKQKNTFYDNAALLIKEK
jgi:phage antirepressor YoqD-like protein